jgi:hypothetical protein
MRGLRDLLAVPVKAEATAHQLVGRECPCSAPLKAVHSVIEGQGEWFTNSEQLYSFLS